MFDRLSGEVVSALLRGLDGGGGGHSGSKTSNSGDSISDGTSQLVFHKTLLEDIHQSRIFQMLRKYNVKHMVFRYYNKIIMCTTSMCASIIIYYIR